jgi:hypothetical protein
MQSRSLCLFLGVMLLGGCEPAKPVAQSDSPELTVEAASIAYRNRDWESYVQFFTREKLLDSIAARLYYLTTELVYEKLAVREDYIASLERRMSRDTEFLRKLSIDWEWLERHKKLPEEEADKMLHDLLGEIADPAAVQIEIFQIDPETAVGWGKIESKTMSGETAKLKTYTVTNGERRFNVELNMRKVGGKWLIDKYDD